MLLEPVLIMHKRLVVNNSAVNAIYHGVKLMNLCRIEVPNVRRVSHT